jgi:hypothetical protein
VKTVNAFFHSFYRDVVLTSWDRRATLIAVVNRGVNKTTRQTGPLPKR